MKNNARINLIPMAGEGQRYKDSGYIIPKPFIDVDGLPMVVRACKSLPSADKNIFVCRKIHLNQFPIKDILDKYIDNVIIVAIDELTDGQAITCLAAREYIPDDAILNIGASDNDMVYNKDDIERMYQNSQIDGWIWTFRNNPAVIQNPNMYGWVETDITKNKALHISCKVPISENPVRDHAIIGAFTFKKAKFFFDAVEEMVSSNARINNEFYVDIAINFAIKSGLNIQVCEVDQYICWGTPKDYEEYQYWLSYFKKRISFD
jgi:dTDP-glucose pyrophosphorylase